MPDIVMTRFIGKFLFFAIALNGIACACPGDLDTSSGSHHEMHVEIDSGANDCHGNGNDEFCHYPEIYQASHAGVAASYNFLQPEDDWIPLLLQQCCKAQFGHPGHPLSLRS